MTDQEFDNIIKKAYEDANKDYLATQATKACEHCPNNPKNGGSGVCFCILGQHTVW